MCDCVCECVGTPQACVQSFTSSQLTIPLYIALHKAHQDIDIADRSIACKPYTSDMLTSRGLLWRCKMIGNVESVVVRYIESVVCEMLNSHF